MTQQIRHCLEQLVKRNENRRDLHAHLLPSHRVTCACNGKNRRWSRGRRWSRKNGGRSWLFLTRSGPAWLVQVFTRCLCIYYILYICTYIYMYYVYIYIYSFLFNNRALHLYLCCWSLFVSKNSRIVRKFFGFDGTSIAAAIRRVCHLIDRRARR